MNVILAIITSLSKVKRALYLDLYCPDLPDDLLGMFMVSVPVHLFPYVSTRSSRCGDGGTVVSVTEAFPL